MGDREADLSFGRGGEGSSVPLGICCLLWRGGRDFCIVSCQEPLFNHGQAAAEKATVLEAGARALIFCLKESALMFLPKDIYLIASHRQEVTAMSTLPGNLTLPCPHHTHKKIFAWFWVYMGSDSGQLSDLSQHSFNFMMQTKTLLRATSPRVPSTPSNCRKEGVCCREEWLQMSLHLPDPSCDLAQSFRVKNNHGLKSGVKSKLLGLHGNQEKEKGKP